MAPVAASRACSEGVPPTAVPPTTTPSATAVAPMNPPVAVGAARAVPGAGEHELRRRIDRGGAPHVGTPRTGGAVAFSRRRHRRPAFLAGGGVEGEDSGGLALSAVVHVGAEHNQTIGDDGRRFDLAGIVVVAAPADLVLPPELAVVGPQRVQRLSAAEVHGAHTIDVGDRR